MRDSSVGSRAYSLVIEVGVAYSVLSEVYWAALLWQIRVEVASASRVSRRSTDDEYLLMLLGCMIGFCDDWLGWLWAVSADCGIGRWWRWRAVWESICNSRRPGQQRSTYQLKLSVGQIYEYSQCDSTLLALLSIDMNVMKWPSPTDLKAGLMFVLLMVFLLVIDVLMWWEKIMRMRHAGQCSFRH